MIRKVLNYGRMYNASVRLVCPTQDEIRTFLLQHNYILTPYLKGKWIRAEKEMNEHKVMIDVPTKEDARDYQNCIRFMLNDLSVYEGKSLVDLVREMVNHDDQCCGDCKFCEEGTPDDPVGEEWGVCKASAPQWAEFTRDVPSRPRVVHRTKDGGSRVASNGSTKPCEVFEPKE